MQRNNYYTGKNKILLTLKKILAEKIWQHIRSKKCNEIGHY